MFKELLSKTLITFSICGLLPVHANFQGCQLPDPLPAQICQIIKTKEVVIREKKQTLRNLREIQDLILKGKSIQDKIEAERLGDLTDDERLTHELALAIESDETVVEAAGRLEDRIINPQDSFELIKIDEQINDEINEINENDNGQLKKGIASIGGLIISSVAIAVMNRSTKGQTFKRRLMAQVFPSENKLFKWTANAALIVSLAMGFFAAYKMFENHKEKTTLMKMSEILSTIKDQADNIATREEELDEMESCYWLQVDQLVQNNLATESPTGLQCL